MSLRYGIKEIFRTIQGEGERAGTSAVFVRFTGCNLWDGHPLHRDQEGNGACAKWCDTDFLKGVVLDAEDVLSMMAEAWPLGATGGPRWAVLTGGEPTLQLTEELLTALHSAKWRVAIETNGTRNWHMLPEVDHVCVSPKLGSDWHAYKGRVDELKVVLPGCAPMGVGWTEKHLEELEAHYRDQGNPKLYVQPQDPMLAPNVVSETRLHHSGAVEPNDPELVEQLWQRSVAQCVRFVHRHPTWRMSPQTHKFLGLE
jgi:organic radical activating enzyme